MNRSTHLAREHRVASSVKRDGRMINALCAWFEMKARDFPWRRRRTGYTALVAEAMLQQTQASRVINPCDSFLRRFPTIRHLAAASQQEVLAMWQGLGYYRRALHLHDAARLIVQKRGGRVPTTVSELRRLPGVGRYTAGAIASIVYGRSEPIVDGNVKRVLMRYEGRKKRADDSGTNRWAWATASRLVRQASNPGAFNEALMELGAVVCTPRSPRCECCPLRRWCRGYKAGAPERIPLPRRAVSKNPVVHHHSIVIRRPRSGKILLERRPDHGMWSNMWQTPTIESDGELSIPRLKRQLSIPIRQLARRGSFAHHTTHRRITFHVFEAISTSRGGVWKALCESADFPMSAAQRRVLFLVTDGEYSRDR